MHANQYNVSFSTGYPDSKQFCLIHLAEYQNIVLTEFSLSKMHTIFNFLNTRKHAIQIFATCKGRGMQAAGEAKAHGVLLVITDHSLRISTSDFPQPN